MYFKEMRWISALMLLSHILRDVVRGVGPGGRLPRHTECSAKANSAEWAKNKTVPALVA